MAEQIPENPLSRLELLRQRLDASEPTDDTVEINRAFLVELVVEQEALHDQLVSVARAENDKRLIATEDLEELLEFTRQEFKRGGSFEGRISYSVMHGPDGVEVPEGQVAVRAFVRTGNDMGQGGALIVDRNAPWHEPQAAEEEPEPKVEAEVEQTPRSREEIEDFLPPVPDGDPDPAGEVADEATERELQAQVESEREIEVELEPVEPSPSSKAAQPCTCGHQRQNHMVTGKDEPSPCLRCSCKNFEAAG